MITIKTNRGREVEFTIEVGGVDITEDFEDDILSDCEETPDGELLMSDTSLEQLIEFWQGEVDAYNNGEPMMLEGYHGSEASLWVDADCFTCY